MKKYLVSLTIFALIATFFAGCKGKDNGGGNGVKQDVKSITVDPTSKEVFVGDSFEFSVKVDPATVKAVFSVDKPEVVKLEGKKVTALAEGTAVVTAKAGSKSATLTVVVKNKNEVTASGKVIGDVYFLPKEKFTTPGAMTEEKTPIFDAMTKLGWENQGFQNDPQQKISFAFWATKADLDSGKKLMALAQYTHNPQSGPTFMILRNIVSAGSFSEELSKKLLKFYGFTANFQSQDNENLGTVYFGNNTELGITGAIYHEAMKDDATKEFLNVEVFPTPQQSIANFQPNMKDFRFENASLVANINALLK